MRWRIFDRRPLPYAKAHHGVPGLDHDAVLAGVAPEQHDGPQGAGGELRVEYEGSPPPIAGEELVRLYAHIVHLRRFVEGGEVGLERGENAQQRSCISIEAE